MPVTAVGMFDLTLKNPCEDVNFTKIVPIAQPTQSYKLGEPSKTFDLVEFSVLPSICGDLEYLVTKDGSE